MTKINISITEKEKFNLEICVRSNDLSNADRSVGEGSPESDALIEMITPLFLSLLLLLLLLLLFLLLLLLCCCCCALS